jgi:hypothetical protein
MALFVLHAWIRFDVGLMAGVWIGAFIGMAVAILLVGRRMRQLEAVNALLRMKLQSQEKGRRMAAAGGGPSLVPPVSGHRPANSSLRAVGGR